MLRLTSVEISFHLGADENHSSSSKEGPQAGAQTAV